MDVKLVVFKPNGQRKDLPLTKAKTVIGRGEDCDLRVPLMSVSRRHCELDLTEQGLAVKDLASANGTYVNNKRVNEQVLKAGDRLVVGPIVFTLQIDGVPEEVAPVKTRGQRMAEAGAPGAEEIIDLEADVIATGGEAGEVEVTAAGEEEQSEADALDALIGASDEEKEIDPISALEALAAETEEEDRDGKKK